MYMSQRSARARLYLNWKPVRSLITPRDNLRVGKTDTGGLLHLLLLLHVSLALVSTFVYLYLLFLGATVCVSAEREIGSTFACLRDVRVYV